MKKIKQITKDVWKGKSLIRSYLNYHLSSIEISGNTIDIGGGSGEGYVSFMRRTNDVKFDTFDLKVGNNVDFEKDLLPSMDNAYDTVLFLNVMEHIFNHQHIANEVIRITKAGGKMVGYVPFLMWYHPDHKDFFRYTHEAIEIIFKKAGAKDMDITPNYCGPFIAGAQMFLLSLPKILRPLVFWLFYGLDNLYFLLKKNRNSSRYVLGYLFVCRK